MTPTRFSPYAHVLALAGSAILALFSTVEAGELGASLSEPVRLSLAYRPEPEAASGAGSSGPGAEDSDLAKKLQNPVSDLVSVPLQFNYDEGFGPKDASRFLLNVQPVIPVALNEDWNLIIRTIVPVIHLDSLADGLAAETGLGDIVQSFFFSPQQPVNGWIIGAGPVFLWPTATDELLGSEKWGAGPTAVVLRQESGWTYGLLANHLWSYAGENDRSDVNATLLQPFLNYTFPTYTTVGILTEASFDWNEDEWTLPLIGQISQLLKIGDQPVQVSFGAKYYADSPDGGPEWGLRFTFTLLFPR